MNILIKLSSRLICELLCDFFKEEQNECLISVATNKDITDNFRPDLILADFNNIDQELFSQWPDAKVVLIDTGLRQEDIVNVLLSYKIAGVISTHTDISLFKKALEVIHKGQMWIDNGNIRALLSSLEPLSRIGRGKSVSDREKEIIDLVCQGCTNKEMASKLSLSEQTVKAHLSRIFRKFNVSNRSQLVALVAGGQIR
ncbi:MAG: LuxR C-terminal-related transcriptional regulator [Nitrospirota bacterium]